MRKPLTIVSQLSRSSDDSHPQCEDLKKLNDLSLQKRLTPCLELLEQRGLVGNVAIFILSQVSPTLLGLGSSDFKKIEKQGELR